MIVPAAISEKFNLAQPYIEYVARVVKETVLTHCENNGFAYVARTKTAESLAEKLETGRYKSWSSIDDLFACSIIIPTLAYESTVIDFLNSVFAKVDIKERGKTKKDPSVFRFDATRFIGRLRFPPESESNKEIASISFEIQVRSAFEHAWSVTTHALAYKSDSVDWQSMRLAAQLKASVEQLDGLVLAFEGAAGVIKSHPWPEIAAKQHIEALFKELIENGNIPSELRPSNWQRFCDNVVILLRAGNAKSRLEDIVPRVDEAIRIEVDALGFSKFPRSISLIQFVFGSLTSKGIIAGPYNSYTPLITNSLIDIYPAVADIKNAFRFD